VQFIQLIISGSAQDCIYGLIALGFVLIYKATETVSFAQGELMMLGAFCALALLTVLVAGAIWIYFRYSVLAGLEGATRLATLSLLLTLVISFLFAAVSAWAVAMISITPISGMTLTTLIVAAVVLAALFLFAL